MDDSLLFRETTKKVKHFKELGAACVEMAASAQFWQADFAQILFTADALNDLLNDLEKLQERGWGKDAHEIGFERATSILDQL